MLSRRLVGMLTSIVLVISTVASAANRTDGPTAVGMLTAKGDVWVDHQPAFSSTALFSGEVVATGKDSVGVLTLRDGTTTSIVSNSEVELTLDGHLPSLNLRQGALALYVAANQSSKVSVLGSSLIVEGLSGFPAVCRIAVVGSAAAIIADKVHVKIHGAGPPVILAPGQSMQLEAGSPQGGVQQAGKVSAAIPAETVQRQGKGSEIVMKVADAVNWEDLIRTLKNGRVRIELLDGSFLNVGARSVMRVTRHDPQTQQTQVEFTLGRLRGEVVKISKPGGGFEVRTQTAVIGVVGTVFLIRAAPNVTRVHCIEGALSVRNINPAIVGQITVHAGQFTSVSRGLPPGGVFQSPASEVQNEVAQTNAQPAGAVGGAAPGAQPTTAAGAGTAPSGAVSGVTSTVGSTVSSAASAAAAGTSVGLTTVAVNRLGSASSQLNTATSSFNQTTSTINTAASSASSAATAATSAATAAGNTNTIATSVSLGITVLSPSTPCGCP